MIKEVYFFAQKGLRYGPRYIYPLRHGLLLCLPNPYPRLRHDPLVYSPSSNHTCEARPT